MPTWTEKQIANLTGLQAELYQMNVSSGMRPAEALNASAAQLPSAQQAQAAIQSNQLPVALGGSPITGGGTSAADFRIAEQLAGGANIPYTVNPQTGQSQPITPTSTGSAGGTSGSSTVVSTSTPGYSTSTSTPGYSSASSVGIGMGDVNAAIQAALSQQQANFQKQLDAIKAQYDQQALEAKQSQQRSAYEVMKSRFDQMGIPELGTAIESIFKGTAVDRFGKAITEIPTSSEGFYLDLISTKPYYERFGQVNEQRIGNGYKALTESDILGLEDQYQKVMESYSMPKGFYDNPTDFQTFLKNDKSASEVADDLQAYSDFVDSQAAAKPEVFNALATYYGIGKPEMTAYYADPTKGQAILEQVAGKNKNTAAALIQGLSSSAAGQAEGYGAGSLSYAALKQHYSNVAQDIATTGKLADIYGMNYGQREAVAGEFGSNAQSIAAQQRVRGTALAQFSGSSGIGGKALGGRTSGIQ